ncbi:MAG: methyltransferase family protein [Acidobacteriota bacterium]
MKKAHEILHALASGSERRRRFLTPVGLLIVTGLALAIVFGSLFTDDVLALPRLLPGAPGSLIGLFLLAVSLPLWGWCIVLFKRARGTPVPFNPPREFVVVGPYAWTRNPMTIGVFGCLVGLGFLLHSLSMVVLWTPLAFGLHAIAVKRLEEPELELRFGARYSEYRQRVPMFVPKSPRRASKVDSTFARR